MIFQAIIHIKEDEAFAPRIWMVGMGYRADTVLCPQAFAPRIWMVGMGASSVDFELVVWVEGEHTKKIKGCTSTYLQKIYALLYKHSISIPFPQMDVHLKKEA